MCVWCMRAVTVFESLDRCVRVVHACSHRFYALIQRLLYLVAFVCKKFYTLLCSLGLLVGLVNMLFEIFDLSNEVSDLCVIRRICV